MSELKTNPEGGEFSAPLPDRFNHLGTNYDSPIADLQLSFLLDRLAEDRTQPNAIDIFDVVRCELIDINKQKEFVSDGDAKFAPSEESLARVQDTLLEVAAGQGKAVNDSDKEHLLAYIGRQKRRWNTVAKDPHDDEEAKASAARSQQLFATFEQTMFSPIVINDAENSIAEAEAFANAHETTEDDYQPKEALPTYEYKPDKASDALAELRDTEEVSFDDIRTFYNAAAEDLREQQKAYDKKYPGKRNAIGAAAHFFSRHSKEEDIQSKHILVSILPDDTIHVGFKISERNPDGTQHFSFSLTGDMQDPQYLGVQMMEGDQFDARLTDLAQGVITSKKLQDEDPTFIADIKSGEAVATNNLLSCVRVLDLHRDHLRGIPEEAWTDNDEKDALTLNAFSAQILKKAGFR
ncbi:MAG: hypothetical protein H0W89_06970 [Candidatus Levybacteria bacterium]|nr:hypothetical protein [Candidatus Levybacteria bacterium]